MAIFAVVLAICVIGAVLAVVAGDDSGSIEINLGDDTFAEIDAMLGAELIDEQGPLIFPDPAGGTPAAAAAAPRRRSRPGAGSPSWPWPPAREACVVEWRPDDERFRDCEGTTYPADGTGLTRYVTTVEDGQVTVDLRTELDATPTP